MNLIENMMYEQCSLKESKKRKRIKESNEEQFRGYTIKFADKGHCTVFDKNNKIVKTDIAFNDALKMINNFTGNDEDNWEESLHEDTVKKSNGKWANRGDTGKEHGTFRTKKQADAQRKAMYANGYKGESLSESSNDTEELNDILYKEAFDLLKQAYKKFTVYYKRTKDPDTVMVARYLKKLIDGDKGDIDKIVKGFKTESLHEDFNEDETFSPDYDWEMDISRFDDPVSPYYNGDWEDDDFDEDSAYEIASRLAKGAIEDDPYEVFDTYGHFGSNPDEFNEVVTDLEDQLNDPKSRDTLLKKIK